MTDLGAVVPDISTAAFSHLLPSLERKNITCADLLTLDAVDIAKHAQLPARDVDRLAGALLDALHAQLHPDASRERAANPDAVQSKALRSDGRDLQRAWRTISTLDERLDAALNGGFPLGRLSEITGESGAAKTTLLHTLLLSAQLPSSSLSPTQSRASSVYISTEAPLQTPRLNSILKHHPRISALPAAHRPTLTNILSIQTPDLESQFHILKYQLPVALSRHNVTLVAIDSITANFRAEYERGRAGPEAMARRSAQLTETAALLSDLAWKFDVAVVVANQVADRFETGDGANRFGRQDTSGPAPDPASQRSSGRLLPSIGAASQTVDDDNVGVHGSLTLDYQQRWFTGWGDVPLAGPGADASKLKTPSLGLVWSNQIACRVALTRERRTGERRFKIVFAPWCKDSSGERGTKFEVVETGLRSCGD